MNKPVCITQTREQLLQRLSTRRPLYQAIKENLPKSKALHAELMEPRVLLSADLVAAGAVLDTGLDETADVLDQFFNDAENLLNQEIPLLVIPASSGEGVEAATLTDLMSLKLASADEIEALQSAIDDAPDGSEKTQLQAELAPLQAAKGLLGSADTDGNSDDTVSLSEFFDEFFYDGLKEIDEAQTEADFALDIEGLGFSQVIAGFGAIDFVVDVADGAVFNDDDNLLKFDLSVTLAVTQEFDVDLGLGFDETGVTFNLDEDLRSEATTTFSFDMTIGADIVDEVVDVTPDDGIDQSVAPSQDFFLQLGSLSMGTDVNETIGKNDNGAQDVQVGFLGVAAANTSLITLKAGANYNYSGGVADGKFTDSDLDSPGNVYSDYTETEDSSNTLSGNIQLTVDAPFDTFVGISPLNLSVLADSDPFETGVMDDRFNVVFDLSESEQADLDELRKFDKIDPSSIVAMLGKAASAADGIAGNEAISGFDIPFTSSTVGDVLDFADLVADKLLYKDWPELWAANTAVTINEARSAATELLAALPSSASDYASLNFDTLAAKPEINFLPVGSSDQQKEDLLGSLLVLMTDADSALYNDPDGVQVTVPALVLADPTQETSPLADEDWAVWLEGERSKLLDGSNKPTFNTVQELSLKLTEITVSALDLDGPDGPNGPLELLEYVDDELRLNLGLSQDVTAFEVPLDFNLNLDPIGNISNSDGSLTLGGDVGIGVTLGIDLGEVTGFAALSDDTPLAGGAIRIDVQPQSVQAITSDPIENFSLSTLPNLELGTQFTLNLTGVIGEAGGVQNVVIPPQDQDSGSENTRNTKLSQIVDDINVALNDAGVSGYIVAERTPEYFRLALSGPFADANDSFTITSGSSVLGLANGQGTTQEQRFIEANNPASPDDLSLTISGKTITVKVEALAYNSNILNLARDLNQAILADDQENGLWVLGDALDENGDAIQDPDNVGETLQERKPKVVVTSVGNQLVITPTDLFDLSPFAVSASDFHFSGTPNKHDFIVTTSNGDSYPVSLEGATTLNGDGDSDSVAAKIAAATGGNVELSVLGDRLVLTEKLAITYTDVSDDSQTLFSVAPTNGSKAALQLGLVGFDATTYQERDDQGELTGVEKYDGRDGVIKGTVIAGPTLADRVFLDNASINGGIALEASNLSAVGSFGFVDINLSGGGSLTAGVDVGLKDPDDGDNKFTLAQLESLFLDEKSGTDGVAARFTSLINSEFEAGGSVVLDVGVASGVDFFDDLANASVAVNLTYEQGDSVPQFELSTEGLSALSLGKFEDIGFSEILDGIIAATDLLASLEGEEFGFLSDPIPLINASVTDFLSIADKLDAAVQSALENPAGSLQQLEQSIESALGVDDDLVTLSLVGLNGNNELVTFSPTEVTQQSALRIDLGLDLDFSEYVGLDLDLQAALDSAFGKDAQGNSLVPELLKGATLAGSAGLAANGNVRLNLAFGVGLQKNGALISPEVVGETPAVYEKGNLGQVYVFGGTRVVGEGANQKTVTNTGIAGSLSLAGEELNFRGAIGPAGIFVKDGDASAVASFGAGLNGIYVVGGDAPGFAFNLDADFEANLPVSFPTESSTPVDITFFGETNDYDGTTEFSLLDGVPSISADGIDELLAGFDPSNLGLLDNILLVVDGVDLFLDGLQDVLDGDIGGMTLPLVGDKLADGAQFIADFRENFVDNFREGVQGFADANEPSIVVTLLTDLLNQIGFNDVSVTEFTNINDVPRPSTEDAYIQWDVSFGDEYTVDAGIDLDLGIPGLGLETEGAVELGVNWGLDLGFGLSGSQGAFLDLEGEELAFGIDVALAEGTSITGTLGFLELSATDGGTRLEADFAVDVGVDETNDAKLQRSTITADVSGDGVEGVVDVAVERLSFSNLGSLDFDVNFKGAAEVDLDLNLQIEGASSLPQINANLGLLWEFVDREGSGPDTSYEDLGFRPISEISGDAIKAGLQTVGFTEVGIDAGSLLTDFLGPILVELQGVTEPLEDIVDFITAPLPVISDLGPPTSLLDIAQAILPQELGFVESLDDLLSLVNSVADAVADGGDLIIPFGDFDIFNRAEAIAALKPGEKLDLSKLSSNAQDSLDLDNKTRPEQTLEQKEKTTLTESQKNSSQGKFLTGLKNNGSFSLPFLTDPTQVFGLLTGGDIDLFEFVMKPLGVEFEYSQFFPILGPLGASITGSFSAIAKLAFGFDTSGIRQFADSGFGDPGLIFNGLYLDDYYGTDSEVPELELNLSLEAAAELNLGFARGGVSGGVYANVLFDLNDPNLDSKVRIEELLGNVIAQAEAPGLAKLLAPLAVFDVSGEVYAQLKAFLEVDVLLFSIDYSENITPRINIFEFDIPFTRPVQLATEFVGESGPALALPDLGAPQPATFAVAANVVEPETAGSVLQLSVGELADLRLNGDVTDGNDEVIITENGDGLIIQVKKDGVLVGTSTSVEVPDTIRVLLGEGNDSFDASGVTSDIKFEIYGGSGNDDIILGGNASGSYVEGGVGDDFIVGTGGSDILIGQAGNDIILGEGGNDAISGDQLEIGASNTLQASPDASDGSDWISGGTDDDIIFGSGGEDTLLGDAMRSSSWMTRGDILGIAIDVYTDSFDGGTGADLIVGDGGLVDLNLANKVNINLPGGVSAEDIRAGATIEIVSGVGAYEGEQAQIRTIASYDGSVLEVTSPWGVVPDSSSEYLITLADKTELRGNFEGWVSLTGTGDSAIDLILAGGSADQVYAGGGDDNIRGGSGSDTIYGEEGSHIIYGGADGDTIYGGDQKDQLYGDGGDDWIYGKGGDDRIQGDSENDKLFGGEGFDLIMGNLGDDVLRGGSNADELFGGAGNDYLDGDFGDDSLFGDTDGRVGVSSEYGNDELVSTYGSDILDGEAGSDQYVVNYTGGTADRLVTTFDSGRASTGPDSLTINGSVTVSYDETGVERSEVFLQGTEVVDEEFEGWGDEPSEVAEPTDRQAGDDIYLLRANPNRADGLAFVAILNKDVDDPSAAEYPIERVDYTVSMETLVINSGDGNDYFALDDNRAATTINGGSGEDIFQIGQMFNLPRTNDETAGNIQDHPNPTDPDYPDGQDYNEGETDVFATIETTRGFLSNGITEATTINGGDDNDAFVVFHNKAVLTVNGDDGNDEFTVRAFALSGSQETIQERTDISGGTDADLVQYAVNAPVSIDGGKGEDTVRVIGTEFGDDFIVAKEGVFGVGINVNYVNVETLVVDGGAGDDRFFIQGTSADTRVVGGLGSDSFNVAGDPPPIISNDLLGHSGTISHTIETDDATYKEVRVRDVVANVADNNEPAIVITPEVELPSVAKDDLETFAMYSVVLTQAPKKDERVIVTAVAPRVTTDELDDEGKKKVVPLIEFVDGEQRSDSIQVVFDKTNWNVAQNISFAANGDFDFGDDEDGSRLGNLVHSIKTERISLDYEIEGMVLSQSNLPALVAVQTSEDLPSDGSLNGAKIEIDDGSGAGQIREIVSYEDGVITLATAWNVVPDPEDDITIRLADKTSYSGDVVSASNGTKLVTTESDFGRDLSGGKVLITEGTGAGQERLIVASSGKELTLVKPWETALDSTSKFLIAPDPVEFVFSGDVKSSSNLSPIVTLKNLSESLPTDGSLIGGTIKILDGFGEGQTRGIGAYDADTAPDVLELVTSWNIVPDGTNEASTPENQVPSTFEIRLVGGEIITGEIVDGENRTTINTAPGELPKSDTGPDGGVLRGATVEIISGTGIGQERLIMESGARELTLNKPWETALDDTSVYQIQSYSAVKAPALEVRLDAETPDSNDGPDEKTTVPEVIIIESNGATNVIESAFPTPIDPADLVSDYYEVKLSTAPAVGEKVKVFVQPEETITTRGQVFYKENQVTLGGADLKTEEATGRQYLEFTSENYSTAQRVDVSAINDNVVDGGDTKVFPSIPRVLSDFEGTLTLDGEGDSDLAIGSLGEPLMLPGEKNIPPSVGNIFDVANKVSAVIAKGAIEDALDLLNLDNVSVLISQQYTLEITDGPARGQAVIVKNIDLNADGETYTITFNDRTEWGDERPTSESRFTFSTTNPNLLVNEYERVDVVTIFNNESISNDKGVLSETKFNLTLGGADDGSDAGKPSVNIVYSDMENFTVNLGKGNDELQVKGTHTRGGPFESEDPLKGDYQTVTFINAGSGNDEILIDEINSFLAVKGELGNDTIDASASKSGVGLIAFGDEGRDTLKGGDANDILFGDLGRIDFFDDETDAASQLITRVGLEHDFANMLSKPETGNLEQVPSDQTDGRALSAKLIVTRDAAVGDVDDISGNDGDDIIIAGTGADEVDGGSDNDLILGDNARITLLDNGGNLSELNKSLADGKTRLYDDNDGATAAKLEPNVQRLEPDSDNLGTYDRLNLILINHNSDSETKVNLYGNDTLSGGADDDIIFGQLGNDTIRGEGSGQETGDDYVEGNGGNDTIYGDKGQDVLIGGSSDLFGLSSEERIDGSDLIYGGTGQKDDYNEVNGASKSADADLILGDNARVATLPGLEFNYNKDIKVRAYTLLDYLPGVDNSAAGLGGADELHGELGNDTIHGMIGNDVLFGESQDDNLIGGVGYDRIYGGSGVDGILGDDGLIQVSRNGTAEPLNGVDEATSQQVIRTKGKFVGAVVNPNGEIHKAAELHAWDVGGNDVIYGGLGDDFIHGGSGDDAISGAEALEIHYHSQPQDPTDDTPVAEYEIVGGSYSYNPANPLEYNEVDQKLSGFNAEDPRPLIADFLLNFDQDAGTVNGGDGDGDGIDRIFGDMGNDWIVGGTGADRMFGGLGDDLINADDNLDTEGVDDDEYGYGDFAYGGGGLDVLIANTGRDRLFDWNGEYNSFYVPFSRFGAPTVNRKISPDTVEFLEQLGEFSGADLTLGGDSSLFDELGLVDNADELSKDQKGSPRDPQPGNMKGKYDDAGEPEELNLLAADFPEGYSAEVVVIDDLRAVGQAAVERWLASGELNDAQLTQLSGMVLQIADLGGLKLAQASSDGKTIYIDSNAAGYGWFIDSTAMQDEEFQVGHADAGNVAGKMDLLSVVMHEIGHQLGFGHGDSGVMHESLDAGVRSAGLLAEGSVYTFDDDSGLAATANDEHDHGWVEVATASMATDHSSEQSAQVDWNDSF